jgi:hypothetical protein
VILVLHSCQLYVVRGLYTCDQLVSGRRALLRGRDLAGSSLHYALAGYGTEHSMLNYWFGSLHLSVANIRAASVLILNAQPELPSYVEFPTIQRVLGMLTKVACCVKM